MHAPTSEAIFYDWDEWIGRIFYLARADKMPLPADDHDEIACMRIAMQHVIAATTASWCEMH
ncbi:hypothetical protein BN2476_320019 [Paraburkholderia piptadeniae]|uniref:Uncharacterized protein n=1 Tax=Paraburkholderia piptadeniae TaxID=1701573 RepID=A0A1N7S4K6_9BURK|nr:hypothetical protein BN2476_320019 [Paraburkholderia piptadeniae]